MVQFLGSLFRNETARLAKMPVSWWYDSKLNEALCSLQARLRVIPKKSFELVWPIGGKKLVAEDRALIRQYMSDTAVNHIVVPMNTGNHWYPICFRREANAWRAYELPTKNDGSCGADTVMQVAKFLDQAMEVRPKPAVTVMQAVARSLEEIDAFDFNLARMAELSGKESVGELARLSQETCGLFKSYKPAEQQRRLERLYQSGLDAKPEVAALIAQCLS